MNENRMKIFELTRRARATPEARTVFFQSCLMMKEAELEELAVAIERDPALLATLLDIAKDKVVAMRTGDKNAWKGILKQEMQLFATMS